MSKNPAAVALGKLGGRSAWDGKSAEQRAEIMRQRWTKRPRAKKPRKRKATP